MNKESLSKESQPPIESPFSFLVEIYKKFLLRAGFTERSIYLDFNLESVLDPKTKKLIKRPTEETIITFGRIIGTSPAGPNIEEIKKKVGEEGQVRYSYGLCFEFLKTILSPIIFPGYIAVRTCFEDDKKTFIDEFLINIESREAVLYISDKGYHEGSSSGVGTLPETEKRNPNFTRHPIISVNNKFDFKRINIELTENNFSYLSASHRIINLIFNRLSEPLTLKQLEDAILTFLLELRSENKDRTISNYLPQYERKDIESIIKPFITFLKSF
jgi:hypothetical protein